MWLPQPVAVCLMATTPFNMAGFCLACRLAPLGSCVEPLTSSVASPSGVHSKDAAYVGVQVSDSVAFSPSLRDKVNSPAELRAHSVAQAKLRPMMVFLAEPPHARVASVSHYSQVHSTF